MCVALRFSAKCFLQISASEVSGHIFTVCLTSPHPKLLLNKGKLKILSMLQLSSSADGAAHISVCLLFAYVSFCPQYQPIFLCLQNLY